MLLSDNYARSYSTRGSGVCGYLTRIQFVLLFCNDSSLTWLMPERYMVDLCVCLALVPSPPVIKQRECTSCPEAALIRWESGNTNPVDSYTVELSEMGTDGTESGIAE